MCVFEFLCIRAAAAGMGEWGGGGSRHDLCYILHNVILNQKSLYTAMLCQYTFVRDGCIIVCSCACVYEEKLVSSVLKMSFTPLLICHCVCACVCVCEFVSACVCVCECVYVFCMSRCLFARIVEAQNDPCSLENKPFHTRDLVHYLYHVTKSKL